MYLCVGQPVSERVISSFQNAITVSFHQCFMHYFEENLSKDDQFRSLSVGCNGDCISSSEGVNPSQNQVFMDDALVINLFQSLSSCLYKLIEDFHSITQLKQYSEETGHYGTEAQISPTIEGRRIIIVLLQAVLAHLPRRIRPLSK